MQRQQDMMVRAMIKRSVICLLSVCLLGTQTVSVSGAVCGQATLGTLINPANETKNMSEADRRLYVAKQYTLFDFLNLSPEKFMNIFPGVIQSLRGRPLTEDDIKELQQFSLLLKPEVHFGNSTVMEAKTLGGLMWILSNAGEYTDERQHVAVFPYVCYECAEGVSNVFKQKGIAHRIVNNNTFGAEGGPQNFVVFSLCGMEFLTDLTYVLASDKKRFNGIMIFPYPLLNEERFKDDLYKFATCPKHVDITIDTQGTITDYSIFDHAVVPRLVCSGTVAEDIKYTLRNGFGTGVQIRLFENDIETPIKYITIHENDQKEIRAYIGPHTNVKYLSAITNVETIRIARVYGKEEPEVEIKITAMTENGKVTETKSFADPTYKTFDELYINDTLMREGARLKERALKHDPSLQINTHLIDCGKVKKKHGKKVKHISSFSDEDLKKTALWDDDQIYILKDRFPEGELYLRALDAEEKIRGRDVTLKVSLDEEEAWLKLLFVIDILKRNKAARLTLYIDDWGSIHSDEDRADVWDMINAMARGVLPVTIFGKGDQDYEKIAPTIYAFKNDHDFRAATKVVALDPRMSVTAEGLAERLSADQDEKVAALTMAPYDIAGTKKMASLKGENTVIVHSMSNNAMSEYLMRTLPRAKRAGAEHVALSLTYLGYARQDKIFPGRTGEAISAHAIAEYLYYFADEIFAVTTHVTGREVQGPVQMGEAVVYNLNGFTQLVEYAFSLIRAGITADLIDPSDEEIKKRLISEFTKRPIYIIGPDQGAALAADNAREVLQKRLEQKFGISKDEVQIKVAFMKKKRLSVDTVSMENKLYRFKRDSNNQIIFNELNKPEGEERDMAEINRDGWVFLVDDEIALATTIKSAQYVLVHELGFMAHRILTLGVHGKFPEGIKPVVHAQTFSTEMVIKNIANGRLLKKDPVVNVEAMTDHKKRHMKSFFIATTDSYFSEGAAKKLIGLQDFYNNVNLYRLFAFGLRDEDNGATDAAPLTSA